jgi:hypothetical protein
VAVPTSSVLAASKPRRLAPSGSTIGSQIVNTYYIRLLALAAEPIVTSFRMANLRDDVIVGLAPRPGLAPVEWLAGEGLIPYDSALHAMEARAAAISAGTA